MTTLFQRSILAAAALVLFLGSVGAASADPLSPRVRRVQRTAEALTAKPSLEVQALLPQYMTGALVGSQNPGFAASGSEFAVRLLLVTDDLPALEAAGFTPRTVAGRVVTITVPVDQLNTLAEVRGLVSAEIALPLRPSLDVSTVDVKSNLVNGANVPPYPGYTGAGVVMGIIDSGIDFTHDDFKDSNGNTRILAIWDQNDTLGPRPNGYNYGTVWTPAALNNGTARQKDVIGHGTHVSGIAAGNGRATNTPQNLYKFTGVAPEADIVVVATSFFDDALLDGVAWIHSMASSKPSVVNMSLGGQFGAHDGSAALDIALSALTSGGRLFVAASGNEGADPIHAEAMVPAGGFTDFAFLVPSYSASGGAGNDFLSTEAWYDGAFNPTVTVTTPNGTTLGPVPRGQTLETNTPQGRVEITHGLYGVNGDGFIYVDVWDAFANQVPAQGTWKIRVTQAGSSSVPMEVDFWLPYSSLGPNGLTASWSSFIDPTELVNSPASSAGVIAVGAYTTKTSWQAVDGNTYQYTGAPALQALATFSSAGPNRDGVIKPEITAPGFGVASSKSSHAPNGSGFNQVAITTPDGKHVMATGTSMATPHVAGTLALLLERQPNMNLATAMNLITTSARTDGFTGTVPNGSFGHGKLDANAAMNMLVPVRLLSILAAWEEGNAVLRWELVETEPAAQFTIERAPSPSGPFETQAVLEGGTLSWRWVDENPNPETPWYRVSARERDGSIERFGPVKLQGTGGIVRLLQNAPNPFSAGTTLRFDLDIAQPVRLDILDVRGRLVATVATGEFSAGRHETQWNGASEDGREASAGIYFYRLATDSGVQVRRMMLVR